jgi:mono/diheme cytochrome c family protein
VDRVGRVGRPGRFPPIHQLSQTLRIALTGVVALIFSRAAASPSHLAAISSNTSIDLLSQSAAKTVWDGVYTAEQARRGEQVYKTECSYCHRDDLSGGFFDNGVGSAPPLAGPRAFGSSFVERWKDLSIGEMVATIAQAMPQQKPATLTLQAYVDVVSYLLAKNEAPAGATELPIDIEALGRIAIRERIK